LGYEATSGRYASFFLGQLYQSKGDQEKAQKYYRLAVDYAEKSDDLETGYTLYAILNLARIAKIDGDYTSAKDYCKQVKKLASRKDRAYKEAKELLKDIRQDS
jgi:tetratricopeptide (TPR) repeat protein